jgi:PAS domain S-box-containing protein
MDVARRPEPTDPTADSQRRRTLAAAQIGAWSRNLGTGAGHVDPAWCQSLGLDPCQGDDHFERWARRIHPDDAGRFLRSSADLLSAPAAKAEFELEYRILTLDSRWLWIMQRGRITRRSSDGRPLEAAGICIEIDARKRAEVEAQENESRLATALWGAQASFWQIHRPSDTAIRSPLWYAMTGYSREAWEDRPKPWFSRIHPEDQAAVQRLIDEHLDGRSQSLELKYRIRCANGAWKWIMDRGRVVEWDFDGQPISAIGVSMDIDEQKRAEIALRSSEMRLETAIWGAGVGLYELDCVSGATRWLNDWCERFDLEPCDGPDHVDRWDSNIHPEDLPAARARFSAHLEGREEYYDAEYRIRTRSGTWRWLFERGRVVERAAGGAALRLVGTCMDIDERKRAEVAAEASQQRLQFALEGARGCLWEWDVERQIFNDAYYLLHGVDPAEGRKDPEFWRRRAHPDDVARISDADAAVIEGRLEFCNCDYRIRHGDGQWRWMVDRFRAEARDVNGRATRLVGFAIDVTAEVSAREALRQSQSLLTAVTVNTPAWLLLLDREYRIRFINRKFRGRSVEELIGEPFLQFVDADAERRLRELYDAVLADGEARAADIDFIHADDVMRTYDHRVAPVLQDGVVTGLSIAGTDITEKREAERRLRRSDAMLATLASSVRELLTLFDRNLRCVFVNRPVATLPLESYIGCTLAELAPAGYVQQAVDAAWDVLANGTVHVIEQSIPTASGQQRHIETRLQPAREGGEITGVVVIGMDVTERVKQRESLRTQGQLMSMMREAVLLVRDDYIVVQTNPAFDALLCAAPGTLNGQMIRPLFEAAVGDVEAFHRSILAERREFVEHVTREFDWRRPDGVKLRLIGTFTPVQIDGVMNTLAVYVDVTQERALERQILESASREQRRLSSDLHDGLGQELTGVALMLRSVAAGLVDGKPTSRERLDEIVGLVNHAIESTRMLARGLAPVSSDQGGLAGALQTLADSLAATQEVEIAFRNAVAAPLRMNDEDATHLFRIAQEAVTNALRHADATRIDISLDRENDALVMAVSDNGQGFPEDHSEKREGLGIRTMQFRASAVRALLEVRQTRGYGVTVRCRVPVE